MHTLVVFCTKITIQVHLCYIITVDINDVNMMGMVIYFEIQY